MRRLCREGIMVQNITTCDFVFADDYKKMSWQEKELFCKTKKHLPNVDPAAVMEKEGLDVSKNFSGLLQNVEENRLDITELFEKYEQLQMQYSELNKKYEKQQGQIEQILKEGGKK